MTKLIRHIISSFNNRKSHVRLGLSVSNLVVCIRSRRSNFPTGIPWNGNGHAVVREREWEMFRGIAGMEIDNNCGKIPIHLSYLHFSAV